MTVSKRPRRADARRNYELIVLAAREVFHEQGAEAPMEEIARRAGVGNATMYRHFHARHELVIAAYADEVTALCAKAGPLAKEEPRNALFGWLAAVVEHLQAKRDVAMAITADGARSVLLDRWYQAVVGATTVLLGKAKRAGVVRGGVEAGDLVQLVAGIALADDARRARLLGIVYDGISA